MIKGCFFIPKDLILSFKLKILFMKKMLFMFFLLNVYTYTIFAQNDDEDTKFTITKKNDAIVVNLLNNYWQNVELPMKQMPISLGIEIYTFETLLKNDRTFNISLGIGFSSHNVHHNALPFDSLTITYFKLIPPGVEYTKNKLTINYMDVPLELNIVSKTDKRNRNFRFAIGTKGGIMINNYLKYVGKDFRNNSGKEVKFKEYRLENVMWYRYGFYVRVSYARLGLTANYFPLPIFEKNKGPRFIPITYGITFSIK